MYEILLVDDHPTIRRGLARTLDAEADLDVIGQMDSAEAALAALGIEDQARLPSPSSADTPADLDPDLVLVDLSLPGMSGLDLVDALNERMPQLQALVVSQHEEIHYAQQALRVGARGYVVKSEAGNVIVEAVRQVLSGHVYVSEAMNEQLLQRLSGSGQPPFSVSPLGLLSDRELEVFEHLGRGRANEQIAQQLGLSPDTVSTYCARIREKLALEPSDDLRRYAAYWLDKGDGV